MNYHKKRRHISSGDKIGKYQLEDVIHQGKYRSIYKARDPFLGRDVAIKVSNLSEQPDSVEDSQQIRNSFFLETQAVGKLQHPNIVSVYDAGVGDRQTYIVMEFIKANSLAEIIESKQKIPIVKVLDIISKCCKALEYAHSKGVIHRDIKPSNILLTKDHNVKIVDFGVAMVRSKIDTLSSGLFGSPSYMSPEQVEEKEVSPSTDLFALGTVLYELLTGKKPFVADNVHTLMYKILHEQPEPLQSFGVRYAEKLQPIIDQVLAKQAMQRYRSALDFATALDSINNVLRYEYRKTSKRVNAEQVGMLEFFQDFNQQEIAEFIGVATWVNVSNGEAVLSVNDVDQTFYIIIGGKATVFKTNKPVKSLVDGDCFGDARLLGYEKYATNIVADSNMLLMRVTTDDLDNASYALQVQFYKAVAKSLVKRLSDSESATDKAA